MKLIIAILILTFLPISDSIFSNEIRKIKFVRYKLKNGLTVILHKDNSKPIVSLGTMYHVGSKDEDSNRTGFAHFFEHLMFEGSKNIKRGEFDKLVLNAGGESNAHTTFDYTYYEMSLPSNQLPLALWMESERLLHLRIDKEGVETQRKVVKEERRERLDNQPYGNLVEILFSMAFNKHPYRWLPIGSNQYIDKATISEFETFYRKFYTTDNAVIVIAGDINIKSTKKLIDLYFNRITNSNRKIIREKIKEPILQKDLIKTVYYNIDFPALSYAYKAPPMGTEDYYPFLFIDLLLSDGESSKLNRKLKIENDYIINLESAYRALEDYGLYSITCYAKNSETYNKIGNIINHEIEKLQTTLLTEREIEKVKNRLFRINLDSISNLSGIAENLAEYEVFYGNASVINTELNRIQKITNEDIKRVANKYFTSDKKIILNYLPPKK